MFENLQIKTLTMLARRRPQFPQRGMLGGETFRRIKKWEKTVEVFKKSIKSGCICIVFKIIISFDLSP